mmetsp:Transcript_19348/g.36065  ORF Transcript_19348/g.36065 Transcript_19348/m.36065 type:complete len:890 (-) Transcript_19348:227-2896(-)
MSRSDLNEMSIENSLKWIDIPDDRNELLELTRELMSEVRADAARQLKLPKIDRSTDLLSKLDEILGEIETEFDRIAQTIQTSSMVHHGVVSLCKSVQKVHKFFETLNATSFLIFKKKSLNKELALLNNDLRHQSTQITSALSLELLKREVTPQVTVARPPEDTNLESRYQKGEQFYYGINVDRNYTLAFEHFLYAAERRHAKSMSMVADIYSNGLGLKADPAIAFRWLLKAEEMGCIIGKYKLGMFLINEIKNQKAQEELEEQEQQDVDLNQLPAERKLFEGASQSQFTASEGRELKREEKFLQAVDLITESAEQGHPDALNSLGQMYELADNYKVALQWYELAAAKGSLRATNLIGMLYFRGLGVPRLLETALKHFKQAAKGGDPVACNNVAKCLEEGKGCERNVEKALDMYKLGADNGSSEAMFSFGYLMIKETLSHQIGVKQPGDERLLILGKVGSNEEYLEEYNARLKEGIKYLRKAVENGVPDAAYQLARLYEQGVGVPYDMSAAYAHYLWAAEIGHGKSSMCAANILYQNSISRNELAMSSTQYKKNMVIVAQLYRQAAKSGIVMSMNAYALLLEDGSGTDDGEPLVFEAAKWYLAAAEEGLLEAAGNLGFLLATHNKIQEFATISGDFISTHDVRVWLESLIASPLIEPDQKFKDAVDKLKYGESKIGITQSGHNQGERRRDIKKKSTEEGQSFYQSKDLHSSILFGENANFTGSINILPPHISAQASGASGHWKPHTSNHNDTVATSVTADPKSSNNFDSGRDEKKSSDLEDRELNVNGNVSTVFSLNSSLPHSSEDVNVNKEHEVIPDNMNMGSEIEENVRHPSGKQMAKPSSSTKSVVKPQSSSKLNQTKSATTDNNSQRKLQNLEKLKSKKMDYSVEA